MPAGQIVGRISEVRPVADVVRALVAEADETLRRFGGPR
jgi:NAD(P)H-dependent flavin oxidoreductase YrpB (nitropropane dioxygenase family)